MVQYINSREVTVFDRGFQWSNIKYNYSAMANTNVI